MHEQKNTEINEILYSVHIDKKREQRTLSTLGNHNCNCKILPVANFLLTRNIDKVSKLTSGIVMRDTTLHLAQKTIFLLRYFSTTALQTYQL